MRLEESSSIKRELARILTDIQPLLWKQSSESRRFVKRGPTALNDWGVYQCARYVQFIFKLQFALSVIWIVIAVCRNNIKAFFK